MLIKYDKPSVHTVLFTEDCPLKCRYCDMRCQPTYKEGYCMEKEELFSIVDQLVTGHTTPNPMRLLFTGGEPFTKWNWIKEIILKYGNSIQYAFNTSGYLLTKDIIKFLSAYNVTWILSVDGDEQISKYQRPSVNGKQDYWEKVTAIFPTLLYYFPDVEWKSILSRRIIPYVHRIWAAAEQQGFRTIFFVPDFGEQPRNYHLPDGSSEKKVLGDEWTESDFEKLQEQYDLIAMDVAAGLAAGKIRTLEREMKNTLFTIFKPVVEDSLECGAYVGRKNVTLYGQIDSNDSCLQGIPGNETKTTQEIFDEIVFPKTCPRDEACPFWNNCKVNGCIKDNFEEQGDYFTKTELTCRLSKIAGNSVLKLLAFMNEMDSDFYTDFVTLLKERSCFWWQHIPRV